MGKSHAAKSTPASRTVRQQGMLKVAPVYRRRYVLVHDNGRLRRQSFSEVLRQRSLASPLVAEVKAVEQFVGQLKADLATIAGLLDAAQVLKRQVHPVVGTQQALDGLCGVLDAATDMFAAMRDTMLETKNGRGLKTARPLWENILQ